jgi:hypothetical protein
MQEFDQNILGAAVARFHRAATAHPVPMGGNAGCTTGSRSGVRDENRGFPITARDVLSAADSHGR